MAIHCLSEINRAFLLSDNGTHRVIGNKLGKFAGNIRNHIRQRRFPSGLFRFFLPEIYHDRILTLGNFIFPKFGIRQNAGDFNQSGTGSRIIHNKKHRVAHILLKHRPAGGFQIIKLVKNLNHLVNDKCFLFRIIFVIFQKI